MQPKNDYDLPLPPYKTRMRDETKLRRQATDEKLGRIDPEGKAAALVDFIRSTAATVRPYGDGGDGFLEHLPDAGAGLIDLSGLRAALTQAGDALSWQICELLRDSAERVENTVALVEAAAGWNWATIEKGVRLHKSIAVRAYGLLPLVRGEAEVMERYLVLRQEAKDAEKFARTRHVGHQAAVKAALANLAQLASYPSTRQFEWDMEARVVSTMLPGQRRSVGEYTLELILEGTKVKIGVERDGKRLKTPPRAMRSTKAYLEAKAAVTYLRSQTSRLRSDLLEGLIASDEVIAPDELHRLLRLPAARDMFERLIWHIESGVTGLFDADSFALRDLNGKLHSIEVPVSLAHSYHLFAAGTLADWQRAIVHSRIVQPIKQAFRELYILTPAELETDTFSNRFANHTVDVPIARRLLSLRAWRVDDGLNAGGWISGMDAPYKVKDDIRAVFELGAGRYFNNRASITGQIYFQAATAPWVDHRSGREGVLPLDAVPPVFFSEVMRDADLVVSVAQRDGETTLSPEAYEQRGSLVRALLDDLGLPGVEVEGHFAHVQGKLARYRVHLGSAAIHIEPGNYLCIIPDRAAPKRESFYLPFADGDDPKFSEVVSKILLLLSDQRITDETILRQIRRHN